MLKKISIIAGTLLLSTALFAAGRFVTVSGAGIGIDNDQATADSQADSQAMQNLETACSAGNLTSKTKIFDQCSQAGERYVCNVNYTGMCQF